MPNTRRVSFAAGVVGILLAAALTACSSVPVPVPVPTPTPTQRASPAPQGNGILKFGTMFPTSGTAAFNAPAQVAGVELAVREINEAGGVLGLPVVVFHRDSGDASTEKIEVSFSELLSKEIDVLIGPPSSVLVERILPKALDAGVAIISPAATSPRLSRLKDDGLLSRTIPSAALQGSLLAEVIGTGKKKARIAVIYFDDESGEPVGQALADAAEEFDVSVVATEAFDAQTKSFTAMLAKVSKATPDAVVLVSPFSAMEQTTAIINGLSSDGLGNDKLWLTSGNLADYSQALPADTLAGARGILEGGEPDAAFTARVKSMNPAVTDYRYAAEAYDATILAALAAIIAENDSGEAVARSLRDASQGGIKCLSFAECLDVLETQDDIDYDGVSGPVDLDATGDPSPANFGIYQYNAENQFARVEGVVGG